MKKNHGNRVNKGYTFQNGAKNLGGLYSIARPSLSG